MEEITYGFDSFDYMGGGDHNYGGDLVGGRDLICQNYTGPKQYGLKNSKIEHPEYRITGIRTHPLWPGICKVLTYEIHNKALLVQNNLKHPDRDKWENEYRTELLEDTVDYYTEEEATWQATKRIRDSMFYGLLDDEDRLPNERDEDEGFTEWERIRCQYIKPAWDYDSDETWIQKGEEDLIPNCYG